MDLDFSFNNLRILFLREGGVHLSSLLHGPDTVYLNDTQDKALDFLINHILARVLAFGNMYFVLSFLLADLSLMSLRVVNIWNRHYFSCFV